MADNLASDENIAPTVGASPAAKKSKTSSVVTSKKPRVKPAHPPTAEMVNSAIKSLKERGGSSLQAIKKYLTSNYKIDAEKLAPFIKKYLKGAVTNGQLIQTKGKGASGSFKLAAKDLAKSKTKAGGSVGKKTTIGDKKPKVKKPSTASKKKSSLTKKVGGGDVKKLAGEKKKAATVVAKSVKKAGTSVKAAKSPKQKSTKATKSAVKKPKTPKPKKVTAAKKPATGAKKSTTQKKK